MLLLLLYLYYRTGSRHQHGKKQIATDWYSIRITDITSGGRHSRIPQYPEILTSLHRSYRNKNITFIYTLNVFLLFENIEMSCFWLETYCETLSLQQLILFQWKFQLIRIMVWQRTGEVWLYFKCIFIKTQESQMSLYLSFTI